VQDIQGEILCGVLQSYRLRLLCVLNDLALVSQFTLYGQMKKGNKPDFHSAADVETARKLYEYFHQRVRDLYNPEKVKNGVFQAMMEVDLKNDGPVGVDYRSEDSAVLISFLSRVRYF
jgi:D-tyrosyl-tRNA(Tyr) deacylase